MELHEIVHTVRQYGFNAAECAEETGLHLGTIYRIRQGRVVKMHPLTKKALVEYLNKKATIDAGG